MSFSYILFGVLPLLAFVIIDSFLGLKAGVWSAIFLAAIEALYTLYEFGTLDELSIASMIFVALFGLVSLRYNNPIFIKIQPVFLGVCFGIIALVFQVINKPILIFMLNKYASILPVELQNNIENPLMQNLLARLSCYLGFGFLLHASVVAYAAFRMSNWWWLIIRGIGLYIMMALCVLMARFLS